MFTGRGVSAVQWSVLCVCVFFIGMGCEPNQPREEVVEVSSSSGPKPAQEAPREADAAVHCITALDCIVAVEEVGSCSYPVCQPDSFTCLWIPRVDCCESDSDCLSHDPCLVGICPAKGESCEFEPVSEGCDGDVNTDPAVSDGPPLDDDSDSKPSDDELGSDDDDSTPGDDELGPDDDDSTPGDDELGPDDDDSTPGDDESDPDDDEVQPGDDDESNDADDESNDADGDGVDDNESEDPIGDEADNSDEPVESDDDPIDVQDPESESNIDICTTYCTLVTAHCVKEDAVDFGGLSCMNTCKTYNLDPEANPTASDSLNCRLFHAAAAAKDPAKHCPNVAPGSGTLCNGEDPFVDKKVCGDQPNEWPGDIHFSSATMMEGFCQTYDSVCGNITMDNVKSTESLYCLRWVGGLLQVAHQYPSNQPGDFELILPELHFVGSLFVGHGTTVVQLPKLALVGGLVGDEDDEHGLYIQADSLTELHMPSLVSVMSHIYFAESGSWSSKYGPNATEKASFVFPLLRNTQNLMFQNLWGVASVEMPKLKTISGAFYIQQTQNLKTFSAPMLENVEAQMRVVSNSSLTALELPSLKHAAELYIVGNTGLKTVRMESFVQFQSNYKYWNQSVQIVSNSTLESIKFNQLKSARFFKLKDLPELKELDAPSLYELTKDGITIENVGQLSSLNGLSGLKKVTGYVDIRNNCQLSDVSALSSIEKLNGALQIVDNVSLTDTQGMSVKDAIGFENISGGVLIYGNDGTGVCSSE